MQRGHPALSAGAQQTKQLLSLPGAAPVAHLAAHAAALVDALRQPTVPPHKRHVLFPQLLHGAEVVRAVAHVDHPRVVALPVPCEECIEFLSCSVSAHVSSAYVPLHMLALQPTVHPCCGPSSGTRRRSRRRPLGSNWAGLVTTSANTSRRPRYPRIVLRYTSFEFESRKKSVCGAFRACSWRTPRIIAGCCTVSVAHASAAHVPRASAAAHQGAPPWSGPACAAPRAGVRCPVSRHSPAGPTLATHHMSVNCIESLSRINSLRSSGDSSSWIHRSESCSARDQSKSNTTSCERTGGSAAKSSGGSSSTMELAASARWSTAITAAVPLRSKTARTPWGAPVRA